MRNYVYVWNFICIYIYRYACLLYIHVYMYISVACVNRTSLYKAGSRDFYDNGDDDNGDDGYMASWMDE